MQILFKCHLYTLPQLQKVVLKRLSRNCFLISRIIYVMVVWFCHLYRFSCIMWCRIYVQYKHASVMSSRHILNISHGNIFENKKSWIIDQYFKWAFFVIFLDDSSSSIEIKIGYKVLIHSKPIKTPEWYSFLILNKRTYLLKSFE